MLKPEYSDGDLPPVGKALADKLDEIFPSRAPDIKDEDRLIWFKAGKGQSLSFS